MRPVLIVFFLLYISLLSAQDYLVVTGKVVDAKTGKPLPYAHVGIPEKGIGTATSLDGDFTLKIPNQYAQSTLLVSYVGYTTYRKSISTINEPIIIKVKSSPTDLQEIVVMDEAGIENIIRKAVRAIPKNYATHPVTNLGFYRESKTDANQDYIYLAEGVLNIYKTSYQNEKEGQISLVQGRKIILQPEKVSSSIGFTSGHLAAHRFDFVKNRADFIDEKQFPDYRYWIEKITMYEDRPVYVINFDRAENGNGRLKGRVYIDTLSYAFLRAEFSVRPDGLRKYDDYPLYVGNWKSNSYTVNYRKIGDKWYFGDALREGTYRDGGLYSNEVIVTEIHPERSGALPYEARLGRNDAFLRVTGTYDEDFWKQYNTSPLSQKLAESVQQSRNEAKAEEVFDVAYMAQVQRLQDSIKMVKSQQSVGEDFDLSTVTARQLKKEDHWRAQFAAGLGTHFLRTEAAPMTLIYQNESKETLLSTSETLKGRAFEPTYLLDLQVFFHKHYFFTWSLSRDWLNSFYRERGLGVGAQYNLAKGRPFFVRFVAQESRLRYARLLGSATNESGTFRADKKKFNSPQVNMYYGSQTHNLKLSLEFALELNRDQEFFIRGGYFLPFSTQQHLYLKERKNFFNRKARIPLSDQTLVTRSGAAFNDPITPTRSFFVTVGMVFK